jgi:glycolate dehydrogenase iron-sulfur subunit
LSDTEHNLSSAGHTATGLPPIPELDRCVHCGLCLNQCPTYRVLRLEADSPRGRIHLVRSAAEGRIELNDRFRNHLDLCLLCRACETACPSGVQFSRIAETARGVLGPGGSKAARFIQNLAFTQLLPYPRRMRFAAALLRLYQRSGMQRIARSLLPEKLRRMEALLPTIGTTAPVAAGQTFPAIGAERAKVAFLNGCMMPLVFGSVNMATIRVLQRNGCTVVLAANQTCCGALNLHNGETVAAKKMARQNIDAFLAVEADAIIVNAAGCGAAMKEYGHLLRDDVAYAARAQRFSSLVKDAGEFLGNLGLSALPGNVDLTVTYQEPCHLAHAQRVRTQPRQLLRAIPGLTLVEMNGADRCCGSAGIYNLLQPDMSETLLEEKMRAIAGTGAAAVVAPNPGCMLQLRHGAQRYGPAVPVYHLMDLLDAAYDATVDLPKR